MVDKPIMRCGMRLPVKTDWGDEIPALVADANTRMERINGTLLVRFNHAIVQLAILPAGTSDVPDMGDAEYTLEVFPHALPFPLDVGVYRALVVGRVPEPGEAFQETHYDYNGQKCYTLYRVLDYPMVRAESANRNDAPAEIRDNNGHSRPLTVTPEYVTVAIPIGASVTPLAVVTRTPYAPEFPARAKKLGGRWNPDYKVWVFPKTAEDAVRALVQEMYG